MITNKTVINRDQTTNSTFPKPSIKGYIFGELVGKGTYGYVFRAKRVVSSFLFTLVSSCFSTSLMFFVYFLGTKRFQRSGCNQMHSIDNAFKDNSKQCDH